MAGGSRIKGITIEIGGETTGLQKALTDVNKRSNSLKTELKSVEKLLKLDPSNTEALAQKQKILGEQVQTTAEKLDRLKKAEEQVRKEFEKGNIGEEQYRGFKREIEFTEGSLRNLKKQIGKVESATVESSGRMKKAFKEVKEEAKKLGSEVGKGIGAAGAAGAAGVAGLVTGMQEYNQDFARLKTNAEMAGRDLQLVEDAFMRITEVTGETDSAVETVSNLLASGFTDNQLAAVIENINGAAIKFSETLKTEGIADGIQETFATGEAVGPFAELLERSGVNLETFNTKLADAKAKGEGANFILETMADLGLSKVYDKYKELNPEVQKNAEANANFQKSMADLAVILTPLVQQVTEFITKMTDWASENPELIKTVAGVSAAVAGLIGLITILAPIFSSIGVIAGLVGGSIALASGIFFGIVAAIAAAIAIGIALWKNWDVVKERAGKLMDKLGPFKEVLLGLVSPIGTLIGIGVKLYKNWDTIMERAGQLRDKIMNLFKGINWQLPKVKLPHFNISGGFDLMPPKISVPKLTVDWYREDSVFSKPAMIGKDSLMSNAGKKISDLLGKPIEGMLKIT